MRENKAKKHIHEFNVDEIDRDLPNIDLMIDFLENNIPLTATELVISFIRI